MSEHISSQFDNDILQINVKLTKMGGICEDNLKKAIKAITKNDSELAEYIIKKDQEVRSILTRKHKPWFICFGFSTGKNMKKDQIAVTMFTLRNFCKNEEEYADSLEKVSKIGYENIQISGVKVETKKNKGNCRCLQFKYLCNTWTSSRYSW